MKYLKKFETHAEYEAYKNSQDYLTPNVSYCVDRDEVHFGKYEPAPEPTETRLVATYNISDINQSTNIVGYDPREGTYYTSYFSAVEIDGNTQSEVIGSYQFDTIGEHIAKFTLIDTTMISFKSFFRCSNLKSIVIPYGVTTIGLNAFYNCTGLSSVTIPDSVTTLLDSAFISCTGLTSVTIPDSVTTMGSSFQGCTGLTSITCLPITPPTINTITFNGSDCPIYVPAESVEAYKAAATWSTYASRIQAIPTT